MLSRLASLLVCAAPVALFAQTAPAQQPAGNPMFQIVPMMLVMFAVIYFLMIRPEQKKTKDRQKMVEAMKKGDKVITIGGMYGVINSVKDASVMVKVSDDTVVELKKSAIADIIVDKSAEPDTKVAKK
jgi:preprotein translocase subunit YajC